MNAIERILSRPTAKPYRSGKITAEKDIYLNNDGHVDFPPDDIENPKNWSRARRWYITAVAVSLVVNATFASSSPSGCLQVSDDRSHAGGKSVLIIYRAYREISMYHKRLLVWLSLSSS